MNKSKILLSTSAFLFIAVLTSACSSNQQISNEAVAVAATKSSNTSNMIKGDAHTHPANKCTNSITHTHPNGKRKHTHHYSCKGAAVASASSANTHRHPANRCTKSTTHTHPGGKKPHTHKYVCKGNDTRGNGTRNPNAHVHPANKWTHSMRHVHPGGNRKHTHHYGR